MSGLTLFVLFCITLVFLSAIGFMLGKKSSNATILSGKKMHSQPDQYGYFVGVFTSLPAVIFVSVLSLGYLFGKDFISPLVLISLGIIVSIISLYIALEKVKPDLRARNIVESVIKGVLIFAAFISVLTTFGILFSIFFESLHFFSQQSFWYFLFGLEWFPEGEPAKFGALPLFAGTFYITFIAMVIAIPIGLLSAIYMSEYADSKTRNKVKPMLEILAGIPTVVYGFFAAITIAPFLVKIFTFFGLDISFQNALAPGIVMGIMIIPIISSLSDDVISSVPRHVRHGSLALGMNKAETIKFVVLPSALPGIIAASLLGVSRALGETMIVVMAAGLLANLTWNPLETMTTVTVRIVDAMTGDQAFNSPETLSAFALGLVLFVVTLVINVFSVSIIRKFHKKYKVSNL